jgi:hypothetical protein
MDGPRRADALVPMPDGSALRLPLRDYGTIGVTGLIAHQASFAVVRRLAGWMAEAARPFAPEVVVGLPTLGHVFGPLVAEALGHPNWVAPGYSRKLWYEERLSVPLASSTTPVPRRLWLSTRALISRPRLVMFDEPSLGLAPNLVEQGFGIVRDIRAAGTTVLMVEQNAMAALQLCDPA